MLGQSSGILAACAAGPRLACVNAKRTIEVHESGTGVTETAAAAPSVIRRHGKEDESGRTSFAKHFFQLLLSRSDRSNFMMAVQSALASTPMLCRGKAPRIRFWANSRSAPVAC